MGEIRFRALLQRRGAAAAIVLEPEQAARVGEGARAFPVVATINGYTVRGRVARMGGESLLGLSRAVRGDAGVAAGDTVDVVLALDRSPREVDVPPALADALAGDAGAQATFDALAYSHRKEFARWVAEAKKDETRERRVAKTLEMLRAGRTRS